MPITLTRPKFRKPSARWMLHLKTLPLTILLTVLLWMYAEAQFTATQDNLPINIKAVAGPELMHASEIVRLIKPASGQFTITVQGPKTEVARTQQQCDGDIVFSEQDTNNLVYVTRPQDSLRINHINVLDSIRVLNALPYFRQRKLRVTAASPAHVLLQVEKIVSVARPVIFHAIRARGTTITPPTATVSLPEAALVNLGGKLQLHVVARPLVNVNAFLPGTRHTITAQLHVHYPGVKLPRIHVTPASVTVRFRVPRQPEHTLTLPDVPVWVAGQPGLLNHYTVRIRPRHVRVTVAGPANVLRQLRNAFSGGGDAPPSRRVIAYLDVNSSDRVSVSLVPHAIRYAFPRGVTLADGPRHVEFQLKERARALKK